MKKSELVSQAYQILSTDDRYVGIKANSLSGVEACLEVFLDLGMLPPSRKFNYKEQQAMRLGLSSLGEFEEYHKWEPEDNEQEAK